VSTFGDSYKVRRIRANPVVALAACDGPGAVLPGEEYVAGRAEVLDRSEFRPGVRAHRAKYGTHFSLMWLAGLVFEARPNSRHRCARPHSQVPLAAPQGQDTAFHFSPEKIETTRSAVQPDYLSALSQAPQPGFANDVAARSRIRHIGIGVEQCQLPIFGRTS